MLDMRDVFGVAVGASIEEPMSVVRVSDMRDEFEAARCTMRQQGAQALRNQCL